MSADRSRRPQADGWRSEQLLCGVGLRGLRRLRRLRRLRGLQHPAAQDQRRCQDGGHRPGQHHGHASAAAPRQPGPSAGEQGGAAYTGLGVVTTPSWVWLLLPLYGGFAALTDGVGKAWVADLLPERAVGEGG